jgi:hypothetical protein
MKKLAPDLFQKRFSDLMEIGRAQLPSLAPEWTDHNAHDPGITLMELLAWVAEAQLFSLSRTRRDERTAYAAMLGLAPRGTRASTGLIWPDPLDPKSPEAMFKATAVIPENAAIQVVGEAFPAFRPESNLIFAPGRIEKLETRYPNRRTIDHTTTNARGRLPFTPFGEGTGRRLVLRLTFAAADAKGLFGRDRDAAKGASWFIGVLAAPTSNTSADMKTGSEAATPPTTLRATLVTDDDRFTLPIVSDKTHGFLKTGAIRLSLDNVDAKPDQLEKFVIEIEAPQGFARPPRVLRIEPNVIPIVQGRAVSKEKHTANGMPDLSLSLEVAGLRFESETEPVAISVVEPNGVTAWSRGRLSDSGPNDNVFEVDSTTGEIAFGNGINGRIPPAGSEVLVSYDVSDGEKGNVARNRKWQVGGISGTFGVNLDPISGGTGRSGWDDDRREARRRSREDHALVSSDDIVVAAKSLPILEVARAWVVEPDPRQPRTGVVRLVAMRDRPGGTEPEEPPETGRWLQAIRRGLTTRMPLASRLAVVAPRYVEFRINAVLEADANRDPSEIWKKVEEELRGRLALVARAPGEVPRQPGVPLTTRDIGAWMRSVDGVRRVIDVSLERADGKSVKDGIVVPRDGLPRWIPVPSSIEVRRPAIGGSR